MTVWKPAACLTLLAAASIPWTARHLDAQQARDVRTLAPEFERTVKPFLAKNCVGCHNPDNATSGVRVDQLDAALEDRHLRLWEAVGKRIEEGTMPPKGAPQPTEAERRATSAWIHQALETARLRPAPKNGSVRRLTVAQYRNTLRDLLKLDDDLAQILPPDAISKDGFVNNGETLQLSPLLMEAYFEIAEEALNRAIVDPAQKPRIQNFRMDLGARINPNPFPDPLILGANSMLLKNEDFQVTELTPSKPFPFEPGPMRTKYRFIEGYAGNDTVRGWREYDSIYHSVFACMRGKSGYPKGDPYNTVPEGLLLRPAIPSDELFGSDGTYGPYSNFKISLRELPDHGRFRVTVTAAKYNDGLLLDPGAPPLQSPAALTVRNPGKEQSVNVPAAGVYQVEVYPAKRSGAPPAVDVSRLREGLGGFWPLDGDAGADAKLEGGVKFVESPFGKALSFSEDKDSVTIARTQAMDVGEGDFTVAAWIQPSQMRRGGIVSLGGNSWTHGWFLDVSDKGVLRIETSRPDTQPNGSVSSPPGVIRAKTWQHVAAVVRRGQNQTRLYVNGFLVAKGDIGPANLDNPKMNLRIGRVGGAAFLGELDDVRIYRRALDEPEVQGLVEPGRRFAQPPPDQPPHVTLNLGSREFSGVLKQPAFLAVRLEAGPLRVRAADTGVLGLDRVVLAPLPAASDIAKRFAAFEKRSPRLGVYVGLRRDCGSTFAPVGPPQTISGTSLTRVVFEGAIRNFPSPDVEKDNVNYLAGVREIAVHSEYTDGRDMPRLVIRSVEFEGPFYEQWPPPTHRNIFIDSPHKQNQAAYARQILRSFATRAYRRPVTAEEEAKLISVFDRSFQTSKDFRQSIKDALLVALTSPQFLFLIENSATPGPEPLDPYELSSKLSYFLWNAPPDRTSLQLAAKGALRDRLDAEVDRMIADPRFQQFTREFVAQWLSLDKFTVLEPDRNKFPALTREARAQLLQEPIQFFEHLVRQNLPVRNLIASEFIMANEVTASYYGLGDRTESGFQFASLAHGRRELGGVLSQAALMAGLSDGRESNPVKRGAWLARKIVAEPPDDPPPNVPALKEETAKTLRERLEQHRNQNGCLQCHAKIDPWGVALEEFDAGGRLKTKPVDARSTLPDKTEVAGIDDLRRYLADDRIDQVAFSVLKHLCTYATGRSLTYNELNFLKQDSRKLRAGGYRMRDMIHYVVNSKIFLEK